MEIQIKNLDHLGIVAGIVDQIGLVEEIDRLIEPHPQQIILTKSLHLDSSSFSLEGSYEIESFDQSSESIEGVKITYGYSKDHRPDLKQFMMDVICTGDGDVPLFVRIGDGNESDRAIFAQLMEQF